VAQTRLEKQRFRLHQSKLEVKTRLVQNVDTGEKSSANNEPIVSSQVLRSLSQAAL